jgi:hypothetical protein
MLVFYSTYTNRAVVLLERISFATTELLGKPRKHTIAKFFVTLRNIKCSFGIFLCDDETY